MCFIWVSLWVSRVLRRLIGRWFSSVVGSSM